MATTDSGAAARVQAHLDARATMTLLHPEVVETIHHHVHGTHELRVSDLRELVAASGYVPRCDCGHPVAKHTDAGCLALADDEVYCPCLLPRGT